MTMEYVDNYINRKMNENPNFIRFSFYELRVKENLSELDTLYLIQLATNKLTNNRYLVYKTGESYELNKERKIVKDNELLIAIK